MQNKGNVTHTNIFSLSNSCVKVRIEKDTSQNHSQAAPPQIYILTQKSCWESVTSFHFELIINFVILYASAAC